MKIKFKIQILLHILVLRPFVKIFCGFNIIGKKNIQHLGRYIIVANHNSHFDTLVLFCVLPIKDIMTTHPVACREYFSRSKFIFYMVNKLFSPIWIERGMYYSKTDPLKGVKEKLDDGHNVIIFPEGTRGNPGKILHFQSGIGRLAVLYPQIPIIPIYLFGPERVLPKGSFFPLPFWNDVYIAPPQIFHGKSKNISQVLEENLNQLEESALRSRHKRKPQREKPIVTIAFLGIDGSGKSTLSRKMTELLSDKAIVCLVSDNLLLYENGHLKNIQPLITDEIRKIISSYAKKAKSLKGYKIPKLAELLLRDHILDEVKKWYSPDYIVLDGAPLLNLTAWASLYKQKYFTKEICLKAIKILTASEQIAKTDPIYKHFSELTSLKYLRLDHLKLPDIVMFLDVNPSIACQRIEKRGETKQVHETEEKLGQLRQAYMLVCDVIHSNLNKPTCVIDGNASLEKVMTHSYSFIQKFIERK